MSQIVYFLQFHTLALVMAESGPSAGCVTCSWAPDMLVYGAGMKPTFQRRTMFEKFTDALLAFIKGHNGHQWRTLKHKLDSLLPSMFHSTIHTCCEGAGLPRIPLCSPERHPFCQTHSGEQSAAHSEIKGKSPVDKSRLAQRKWQTETRWARLSTKWRQRCETILVPTIKVIITITETNLGWNLKTLTEHLCLPWALTVLASYKVLISSYQFEKWTWQQMLVFLRENKCMNNSQKCPFSPLDNKVSALPSTLWLWSRCPSLSNGVQGALWPLLKPAKKALGFTNPTQVFVALNKEELALRCGWLPSSSCLNMWNTTLLMEPEISLFVAFPVVQITTTLLPTILPIWNLLCDNIPFSISLSAY